MCSLDNAHPGCHVGVMSERGKVCRLRGRTPRPQETGVVRTYLVQMMSRGGEGGGRAPMAENSACKNHIQSP